MNREEAIGAIIETIERLAFIAHGGLYPDERKILKEAIDALRGPSPTPKQALSAVGVGEGNTAALQNLSNAGADY